MLPLPQRGHLQARPRSALSVTGGGVSVLYLLPFPPWGKRGPPSTRARRMRGLYPRRQTPHPPSLRSGPFSHKGRRKEKREALRPPFLTQNPLSVRDEVGQ